MKEGVINKELQAICSKGKLSLALSELMNHSVLNALLAKSNDYMIGRLNFTDHGRVHAKIVALNALKLLSMIKKKPTIVVEGNGSFEDAQVTVLVSSWLHDIGCSMTRKDHELIGVIKAQPFIKELLSKLYSDPAKIAVLSSFIEEGILCHLGTYHSTSVEAGIVCVADGTDITKGRARLSFLLKPDIHDYSAMSIDSVSLEKGVKIQVKMSNPAGIFQVEETLIKKLRSTIIKDQVKVIVHIKGSSKKIEY